MMGIIISASITFSMVSVAVVQIIRNSRQEALCGKNSRLSPVVLICAAAVVWSDVAASVGTVSLLSLVMDMMPSVVAMWLLLSSFPNDGQVRWCLCLVFLSDFLLLAYHLCRCYGIVPPIPDRYAVWAASFYVCVLVLIIFHVALSLLFDVKSVMKSGTVWSVVSIMTDLVYLCFISLAVVSLQAGIPYLGVAILGGMLPAEGIRILTDSKFLIFRNQERLIVESMKITSLSSAADQSHIDEVYKELYERLMVYFENKKPYLDSELTINMLVKDLFSNKLYISRAISQYTGRNFCQFVNYYRVRHSMECFRENPDLKLQELSGLCGFNSVVSFSMAFRLFMGETPGEWCRKERSKLVKKK